MNNLFSPVIAKRIAAVLGRLCADFPFDASRVTLISHPPGGAKLVVSPDVHWHESWELAFSLRGSLLCQLPRQPVRKFPPQHLVLVAPGLPHVRFTLLLSKLPPVTSWFNLCLTFETAFMTVGGCGTHALSVKQKEQWKTLLRREPKAFVKDISESLALPTGWRRPFMKANLLLFFSTLWAVLDAAASAPDRDSDTFPRRVDRFIAARFQDASLSVRDIADEAGFSPTHLAMLYKKATGRGVWQSLRTIRLEHAHGLLSSTEYSVKQVAAMTGWSDPLYFSRAYRRHYGYPPTATSRRPPPLRRAR